MDRKARKAAVRARRAEADKYGGIQKLAAEFGVSEKTISRYLATARQRAMPTAASDLDAAGQQRGTPAAPSALTSPPAPRRPVFNPFLRQNASDVERWLSERENWLVLNPTARDHERVRRDVVDLRAFLRTGRWQF